LQRQQPAAIRQQDRRVENQTMRSPQAMDAALFSKNETVA
jgi:hypothetical protein